MIKTSTDDLSDLTARNPGLGESRPILRTQRSSKCPDWRASGDLVRPMCSPLRGQSVAMARTRQRTPTPLGQHQPSPRAEVRGFQFFRCPCVLCRTEPAAASFSKSKAREKTHRHCLRLTWHRRADGVPSRNRPNACHKMSHNVTKCHKSNPLKLN